MADLAEEMIDSRRQFDAADSLADRLLGAPGSPGSDLSSRQAQHNFEARIDTLNLGEAGMARLVTRC